VPSEKIDVVLVQPQLVLRGRGCYKKETGHSCPLASCLPI
jgi:hypothetical protein